MVRQESGSEGKPKDQEKLLPIDEDLGELTIDEPSVRKVGKSRTIDSTRAQLAYWLLALVTVLLMMLLIMLWSGRLPVDKFGNVAAITVTPIIGLLGAAVGYYYGKGHR
jgi:hypothetical protein